MKIRFWCATHNKNLTTGPVEFDDVEEVLEFHADDFDCEGGKPLICSIWVGIDLYGFEQRHKLES
jgi:hypothetical protein